MEDLIKRIEAATGPSRELDYAIFCNVVFPNHKHKWDPSDNNHRYTSSIDAAMTLVQEGWIVKEYTTSKLVPHTFEVSKGVGIGGFVGHSDHSMALALCAAALQAVMSQKGELDGY